MAEQKTNNDKAAVQGKDKNGKAAEAPKNEEDQSQRPSLTVLAQGVRDLSFENFSTDESRGNKIEPDMAVQASFEPTRGDKNVYGLTMKIEVRNKNKTTDKDLFLVELSYEIILRIENIPEERVSAALFIEGGRLLFPEVRHIVRTIVASGGFPPFELEPIDFAGFYMNSVNEAAKNRDAEKAQE